VFVVISDSGMLSNVPRSSFITRTPAPISAASAVAVTSN
jgi:hypothetical protein